MWLNQMPSTGLIGRAIVEPGIGTIIGLAISAIIVFILPFRVKIVEKNLELFFLVMGALAVTIARMWSSSLILDALKAPIIIGSLPIGIFQVVLVIGLVMFYVQRQFSRFITFLASKLSIRIFIFLLIAVLGLISSIISVILTSVLLAEIAACLPLNREERTKFIVVSCFAVGLGAVLTPLGEPLSTILIQKLSGPPYYAGFGFLVANFGPYVIPGVITFAFLGAFLIGRKENECSAVTERAETLGSVTIRAVKVYAFVAALVLFGEGLRPVMDLFLTKLPAAALYWINISSAVLDNATLAAIEITPNMTLSQIICAIMGLLIAGGMLIPGNIPNIVAATKLKVNMKEWAVIGMPIGLAMLAIYFVILIPIIF